jgi:flagellar protein FlgJ
MNNMNISALISNPLQYGLSDPSSTPIAQQPAGEVTSSFAEILASSGLGDQATINNVINTLGNQEISSEDLTKGQRDIQKIGEDFEAIFLSMMLKELRNTSSSEEGGGLFGGEDSDTFGAMFDTFIGQHLAESNQLGIADAVRSYLGSP